MDKKVTPLNAIKSKCWDCSGYYADGLVDCKNITCSLYPYMPYKKMKADLEWLKYNPKRKGHVTWEESARPLSEEQRKATAERFRAYRESKANEVTD